MGVKLSLVNSQKIDVTTPTAVGGCLAGDDLADQDHPGLLNVYYVNRLGFSKGVTCARHQGRSHDVVYVAWEEHPHFPTTLVHEGGHALGLMVPGSGHANMVPKLDVTNVMSSAANDDEAEGRRHFTVGQVFRTNAETVSWLNVGRDLNDPPRPLREDNAARLDCQCGEEDPSGPCPRVVDDIATSSAAPGVAMPWDCYDEVRLAPTTPMPADESPAGIVAGRSWRALSARCDPGMPASPKPRSGATYLRFENLYRPGDCQSHITVFFRRGGVMHQALAEPEPAWTPNANLWKVKYTVTSPIPVTVHVHDAPDDASQELEYALQTFGSANRTGIELQVAPADGCPNTNPAAPDIRVCYVDDGGASEATLPASRFIKVQLDKRKESTVAHFLGRVLGLRADGPPGNIMQPIPPRAPKLTLGQVYHINVGLGSLPPCDALPCPSLTTDLPP
jgi:hypothetical protein